MIKYYTCLFLFFLIKTVCAQSYTFTGNGNWTIASNWANNNIPPINLPTGDTIYISPLPGNTCILNTSQVLSAGASLIVSAGANFIISGNLNINDTHSFSNLLLKVYEIGATFEGTIDTTGKRFFNYDNLNRIVSDSFYSRTVYSNAAYIVTQQYTYSGTDTVAYRRTRKVSVVGSFSVDTYDTLYCKYVNGKYDSDSTVYRDNSVQFAWSKNNFIYGQGYIIRNFKNGVPEFQISASEYNIIHQTKVNTNIIYQVDTTWSIQNGQIQEPQVFETNVSYLPNPNPLYKIFFPVHQEYFSNIGIGYFVADHFTYVPEFLISQQTSSKGNLNYAYTFRADGYPLTAEVSEISGDSPPKKTTLLFVYSSNRPAGREHRSVPAGSPLHSVKQQNKD